MDEHRTELAARLDDVVVGLRQLTSTRAELSLTAAATLSTLQRSGPARLTELAAAEGVSQPSMTALIARMAGQGLVQRSADPSDGRAVVLSLTDAGADLLARRRSERAARLAGPLGDLDEDEVDRIAAALPALARLAGVLQH
ncbi:MarR family winged helix-turn-helix transcriptional regulator [Klenkia brasiliensis]|uniref:DNA-binding transcriptional regulator, MarR family n=1 Tax=Klenkia brasiliensis TaxID=333142 RepID=A0A1G7LRZ3_9ACTN|nr:MarR family transcriptional regulator [Klenkia brasiliensis]SDF52166.1 DNA-binding transcriptional regulator, MarR family [Klenkia brasiliensis]